MMPMRNIRLVLAVTVMALPCQSCTADQQDDLDKFFARRANVICAKVAECTTPAESARQDASSCREYIESKKDWLNEYETRIRAAQKRGSLTFDATRGAQCLDWAQGVDCATWERALIGQQDPSCGSVLIGSKALGAVCEDSFDCASRYCDRPMDAGGNLLKSGSCATRATVGQPCNGAIYESCVVGASCEAAQCESGRLGGEACSANSDCLSHACDSGSCRRDAWNGPYDSEILIAP